MKITPSLLAYTDWLKFDGLLRVLDKCSINGLHVDIMDGHFVPNLAFGPDLVRSIAMHTSYPLDLHLMINCLDILLDHYLRINPRIIIFHPEACTNVIPYIENIKKTNIQVGFAIHPDYPIEETKPFWHIVDRLLIMTVYPGFSGQAMLAQNLEKVMYAKSQNYKGECWVDGGVTFERFEELKKYGVDGVVMGNSFFSTLLECTIRI